MTPRKYTEKEIKYAEASRVLAEYEREINRRFQEAWEDVIHKPCGETEESRLMKRIISSPKNPFNQRN